MLATVTQLPVRQPQAAVPDSGTSTFMSVLFEAAIAEGMRRAYEQMGIPQPPRPRSSVLTFTGPS